MEFYTLLILIFGVFTVGISQENVPNPKLVVKKCLCPVYQVDNLETCEAIDTNLNLHIWDTVTDEEHILNLSEQSYSIEPLICDEGFSKTVFHELPFLTYDGKILKIPMDPTDQYCIENYVAEDGQLGQRIEICIENPKIPLCCGIDRKLNSSGFCEETVSKEVEQTWPMDLDYVDKSFDCGDVGTTIQPIQFEDEIIQVSQFFSQHHMDFCFGAVEEEIGGSNLTYLAYKFCEAPPETRHGRLDENATQVPYCCGDGFSFDLDIKQMCVQHDHMFEFPENIHFNHSGFHPTANHMTCDERTLLEAEHPDEMFIVQDDGSLIDSHGHLIQLNEYCLGSIIKDTTTVNSGIMCLKDPEAPPCVWRYTIIQTCLIISSLFFLITLIIYLSIEELRKRIIGACLISELVALLISQITLIVIQITQQTLGPVGCLAAGLVEIMSVLASFFWLNVMCYDVWATLSVFRPITKGKLNRKVFLKYSIYAWGVPLVVAIIALVLELTGSPIRPNFTPETGCFFTGNDLGRQWGYLYGIILAILLANLFFFCHLAATLLPAQMEARRLFGKGTKHGGRTIKQKQGPKDGAKAPHMDLDLETVKLYLKLFLLMGFPWLIEVFSSFAQGQTVCYLWFLDVINALRGIFVFLIFVCKKKTLQMIKSTWCPAMTDSSLGEASDGSTSRKTSVSSITSFVRSYYSKARRQSGELVISPNHVVQKTITEESEEEQENPQPEQVTEQPEQQAELQTYKHLEEQQEIQISKQS